MASRNWIQGAVKRPGALTAKADKAGQGVQTFAREHAHDSGLTGQQARFALQMKKLHKAANGAVKQPIGLDAGEANVVLVGDGGTDPAAEEYLLLPEGTEAIIAPKLSPNEEPNMPNALRALAETKLRRAASGMYRSTEPSGFVHPNKSGQNFYSGGGTGATQTKPRPKLAAPTAPASPSTPVTGTPSAPVNAAPPPAPVYDPGVGIEPAAPAAAPSADLTSAVSLVDALQNSGANSIVSNQFGRGARTILGAAAGLIKDKLHRAASGGILGAGYNPSDPYGIGSYGGSSSGAGLPDPTAMTDYQASQIKLANQQMSADAARQAAALAQQDRQLAAQQAYWNASTGNQRYATDAQRAIAQMNINAQNAQMAQQLGFNRERLALDRMLGERQAATDERRAQTDKERAVTEAMNMLATRAGRQLIAPGGNTIPSMQPLIGRSIM